mgnify:FL=1
MILERGAIDRARAILKPGDFYYEQHRAIYLTILRMRNEGQPVDLTTVCAALENAGKLNDKYGRVWVNSLMDSFTTAAHVEQYAEEVVRCSVLRQLWKAAVEVQQTCVEEVENWRITASDAAAKIRKVAQRATSGCKRKTMEELVIEGARRYQDLDLNQLEITGAPSGIRDLDRRTNGFQSGEMTIVSALPGGGKTAFGGQVALYCAENVGKVLFFSGEMSAAQLRSRAVANLARLDSLKLDRGTLSGAEKERRNRALERLQDMRLVIDDNPHITPAYILAASREEQESGGLGLVVVDYFGLVQPDGKVESQNEAQVSVARDLKAHAKDLGLPLIVMAQFRKLPVQARGKQHDLDDLHGARALSAEAALVINIRKTEEEKRDADTTVSVPVQAVILKNRFGPGGMVELNWIPAYTRYEPMEREENNR